uniref:Uncharacterized protein n=1 Tax=Arundo donax TaxID=35708 RepID=A0A0A8YD30_ARUDO
MPELHPPSSPSSRPSLLLEEGGTTNRGRSDEVDARWAHARHVLPWGTYAIGIDR